MAGADVKTISVGGKTYAVGLFWQPVQNEKDYLKEIKAAVQTVVVGANLYCLKKGAASQYGLGFTTYKQKAGMPSGASGIANALRDKSSAVAVFKVNEGWWFITIRNNLILSEEDTVYTDENDAKEAFSSMLSIPDWGYKIAPADWGIDDTKEMAAADLLARGQPVDLKSIDSGSGKIIIIAMIALAAGWHFWSQEQEKKAAELRAQEARRRKALLEAEAAKNLPPPPPPPPAPWEGLIDVFDISKKCTVLIVNTTTAVPGWALSESVCNEQQVTSQWRRTYGTAGWIFDAQKFGYLPEQITLQPRDNTYNNVYGVMKIPFIKHVSIEPTLAKPEIQQRINDIFQGLHLTSLRLTNKSTNVKDTVDPSKSTDYPYTEFAFSDAAYRLPLDWANLLKDMNSVEFTSIKWDNNTRTWSYEGKIYEKTDKPKPAQPAKPAEGGAEAGAAGTPAAAAAPNP